MTRQETIEKLRSSAAEIRRAFRVRRMAVFGSTARGDAKIGSDVDILVAFEGPCDFDLFMDLKFYLEEKLGERVDLVTEKAVRPRLLPAIANEAVDVA